MDLKILCRGLSHRGLFLVNDALKWNASITNQIEPFILHLSFLCALHDPPTSEFGLPSYN